VPRGRGWPDFVALAAGVVDRGIECDACLAGAVEVGRSLRDGGYLGFE
jgi:hypothetical protein